jgi:hypothetical protein
LRNASFHFSFLIFTQSTRLLGRGISRTQGCYLHRTTQTQNKNRRTSMSSAGFEPTIPVFERAKTVHVLNRADTVVGNCTIRNKFTLPIPRNRTLYQHKIFFSDITSIYRYQLVSALNACCSDIEGRLKCSA